MAEQLLEMGINILQDMYVPDRDGASQAQKQLAIGLSNRYIAACHWIAYERLGIGNLNRHPLNTQVFRLERPFANLMIARLELCKGCHEFARKYYPNDPVTHWLELERGIKEDFIESAIEDREPLLAMSDWLKMMRLIHGQLENRKNPFADTQPLYFNLIEISCHLAERQKKFDVNFWVPFLKAFRRYYQHIECEGSGTLFVQNNRLWQTAQGKPKLKPLVKSVKCPELARYYCL